MHTIKLFVITAVTATALPIATYAQTSEMDIMRKIFSVEKRALVEDFLSLDEAEAEAFWNIYAMYEDERRELADRRIDLISDYAEQYSTITNEQATAIVNRSFKLRDARNKLQKKYFKKISKAVDAKTATGFMQLEEYIHTAVNFDLYDAIPFVGE